MTCKAIVLIFCAICAFLVLTTNSALLNCWMGYSMGGPPFGDNDEFGPLHEMNCTGESVQCISINCILGISPDKRTVGVPAVRYHSCSRDGALWCRAHKIHCEKMFNGTMSECAQCASNLCNSENETKMGISDKLVATAAIGVLFFFGIMFYCLLSRSKKAWQIHTLIINLLIYIF